MMNEPTNGWPAYSKPMPKPTLQDRIYFARVRKEKQRDLLHGLAVAEGPFYARLERMCSINGVVQVSEMADPVALIAAYAAQYAAVYSGVPSGLRLDTVMGSDGSRWVMGPALDQYLLNMQDYSVAGLVRFGYRNVYPDGADLDIQGIADTVVGSMVGNGSHQILGGSWRTTVAHGNQLWDMWEPSIRMVCSNPKEAMILFSCLMVDFLRHIQTNGDGTATDVRENYRTMLTQTIFMSTVDFGLLGKTTGAAE